MNFNKLLIWLLTVLWFAAGAWWYSHSSCSSCNAETAAVVAPVSTSACPSFSFNDGSFTQNNVENLRFAKSGFEPVISNAMTTTLNDITKYAVEQNPSRLLTITGQYGNAEVNSTKFENLGLARADALKKLLIARGIAEKNIAIKAELNESLCYNATSDTFTGGALLTMVPAEIKVGDTALAAPLFDPRTVYFNTGKNNLNITPELENYLVKVAAYLATNKDKKLLVTGHTDNVGDPNKNVTLSADRAAFVKTILSKRGIPAAQIITEGKGMQVPIADNATAEGKAKNRRVTIVLQ
jgi:OmpA-OmpF porin, OOP family